MLQEIKGDNSSGGCCGSEAVLARDAAAGLAMHSRRSNLRAESPPRTGPPAPARKRRPQAFDPPSVSRPCNARGTGPAVQGPAPARPLAPSSAHKEGRPSSAKRRSPRACCTHTPPTRAARKAATRSANRTSGGVMNGQGESSRAEGYPKWIQEWQRSQQSPDSFRDFSAGTRTTLT